MKHRLNPGGGKGDAPRDVDKKRYDESWLRIFGKDCPTCTGLGASNIICATCNGTGKVDK